MSAKATASILAAVAVFTAAVIVGWIIGDEAAISRLLSSAPVVGWHCFIALMVILVAVGAAVTFRMHSKYPSEIDRWGSDLNLFGYGIVAALGLRLHSAGSWVEIALLATLALYLWNLALSEKMRAMDRARYGHGIESFSELSPDCRTTWWFSLSLGFLPTYFLIVWDLSL